MLLEKQVFTFFGTFLIKQLNQTSWAKPEYIKFLPKWAVVFGVSMLNEIYLKVTRSETLCKHYYRKNSCFGLLFNTFFLLQHNPRKFQLMKHIACENRVDYIFPLTLEICPMSNQYKKMPVKYPYLPKQFQLSVLEIGQNHSLNKLVCKLVCALSQVLTIKYF